MEGGADAKVRPHQPPPSPGPPLRAPHGLRGAARRPQDRHRLPRGPAGLRGRGLWSRPSLRPRQPRQHLLHELHPPVHAIRLPLPLRPPPREPGRPRQPLQRRPERHVPGCGVQPVPRPPRLLRGGHAPGLPPVRGAVPEGRLRPAGRRRVPQRPLHERGTGHGGRRAQGGVRRHAAGQGGTQRRLEPHRRRVRDEDGGDPHVPRGRGSRAQRREARHRHEASLQHPGRSRLQDSDRAHRRGPGAGPVGGGGEAVLGARPQRGVEGAEESRQAAARPRRSDDAILLEGHPQQRRPRGHQVQDNEAGEIQRLPRRVPVLLGEGEGHFEGAEGREGEEGGGGGGEEAQGHGGGGQGRKGRRRRRDEGRRRPRSRLHRRRPRPEGRPRHVNVLRRRPPRRPRPPRRLHGHIRALRRRLPQGQGLLLGPLRLLGALGAGLGPVVHLRRRRGLGVQDGGGAQAHGGGGLAHELPQLLQG
mmetsp:Transcript_12610/g.25058  ORF Transcript_12610/g.25058 Transcript_12610/m.25058 type:complete len:474 (+) Transcript_12610:279-1700(+)